jgi:hypothetical protein
MERNKKLTIAVSFSFPFRDCFCKTPAGFENLSGIGLRNASFQYLALGPNLS